MKGPWAAVLSGWLVDHWLTGWLVVHMLVGRWVALVGTLRCSADWDSSWNRLVSTAHQKKDFEKKKWPKSSRRDRNILGLKRLVAPFLNVPKYLYYNWIFKRWSGHVQRNSLWYEEQNHIFKTCFEEWWKFDSWRNNYWWLAKWDYELDKKY